MKKLPPQYTTHLVSKTIPEVGDRNKISGRNCSLTEKQNLHIHFLLHSKFKEIIN